MSFVHRLPPSPVPFGELRGRAFSTAFTARDALWCARMVEGEEGEGRASYAGAHEVVSCMVRRLAFINDARMRRGQAPAWPDLTTLIVGGDRNGDGVIQRSESGFSQPVSLYWRDIDVASIPGDERVRRQRISALDWLDASEDVRQAVVDVLTGRTRLSVPAAVDFADRRHVAAALERRPAWEGWRRVVAKGSANHFLSNAASRAYTDPVIAGGGLSPLVGALPLLLVAGLGLALFAGTGA